MMLIFGLGYTAGHLARHLRGRGWTVVATRRRPDADTIGFSDEATVRAAIASATHILSSVPPGREGGDPVLSAYGAAVTQAARDRGTWLGYLSSTGVYGDARGAWVDESAATGHGRNPARAAADADWRALGAQVFRLPGIYGPGRSPLEKAREGQAHRVDAAGQVFSRIHVADIVTGIVAGFGGPPGAYNLADDLPAPQADVAAHACRLLGLPVPPLVPLEQAGLSPMARGFYAENRRIATGRARRLLGWSPRFRTYREGLADCLAAIAG
jgi:nucleoside-diphosphate-sugar epimerase